MSCFESPLPWAKRIGIHACGVALVLMIPATSYLLAIRPIHARTVGVTSEREQLIVLIDSAASVRAGIESLQRQVEATEHEVQALLGRLPDRPAMDPLMATLSATAQRSGGEVLSLHPLPARGSGEAAVQMLKLRLRCDHAALCQFLASLDAGPLTIWVAAVELRGETVDAAGRRGGIRYADLTLRIPHAAEKTFAGDLKLKFSTKPEA